MSPVKKNPHAVALGKRGRAANTSAQQAAARVNGRRGGRPPTLKAVQGKANQRYMIALLQEAHDVILTAHLDSPRAAGLVGRIERFLKFFEERA